MKEPTPAPAVDVLIPTCDRPGPLAVTLMSLASQTFGEFHVTISDQGDEPVADDPLVASTLRLLEHHGHAPRVLRNLPRRGMAPQRQFLLEHAEAPYALFLDDDVMLEPDLVERLHDTIVAERCGFVGSALIGLSFRDDVRPHEQPVEPWDGPVQPESVRPDGPEWDRYRLHNAANVLHVQERLGLTPRTQQRYKVAWVGGCVIFDAAALREVGAFEFERELPPEHRGEDVVAQLRTMERFGGAAILPSGAYHQEVPTTLEHRPVDALKHYLQEIGAAR